MYIPIEKEDRSYQRERDAYPWRSDRLYSTKIIVTFHMFTSTEELTGVCASGGYRRTMSCSLVPIAVKAMFTFFYRSKRFMQVKLFSSVCLFLTQAITGQ